MNSSLSSLFFFLLAQDPKCFSVLRSSAVFPAAKARLLRGQGPGRRASPGHRRRLQVRPLQREVRARQT